jgi:hypothetical protein
LKHVALDWREITLATGILVAAGGAFFWLRRPPHDPAETERKRRSYLNQIGRIVEGQVLEIVEAPAEALPRRGLFGRPHATATNGASCMRKMLFYTYSISGVSYETAQDITGLEERACLHRLIAGQPASVKYDPSNPSNSILVAEDWSGLH